MSGGIEDSDENVLGDVRVLIKRLREKGLTVALAESCTAGLAADLMAQIPGASHVLWGSYVCYTAGAKISMLGLDPQRLEEFGMVSRQTACDMAQAALAKSGASIAASVTGIAGPDGDGSGIPAGTVWIAAVQKAAAPNVIKLNFSGFRNEVRVQAARALILELINIIDNK